MVDHTFIYNIQIDLSTYTCYFSTTHGGINLYYHVPFGRIRIKYKLTFVGEMAEWLIAPVLKTGIVLCSELSRVRIPLSPFTRSYRIVSLFFFVLHGPLK